MTHQTGVQELQGNSNIDAQLHRFPDLAHAALADATYQAIPPPNDLLRKEPPLCRSAQIRPTPAAIGCIRRIQKETFRAILCSQERLIRCGLQHILRRFNTLDKVCGHLESHRP